MMVRFGRKFKRRKPAPMGFIPSGWAAILVKNSGVAYSSLSIGLHLPRLVCKIGFKSRVDLHSGAGARVLLPGSRKCSN